ncbi:MAG: hypothetical protein HZB53_03570 [Chloroflexi bacterium]|nr:hypothetical protein [Chloroflexota bacterium]
MTIRRIAFAGSTVAVEAHGLRAEAVAAFLFAHLPEADAAPHITLRVEDAGDGLVLRGDSEPDYFASSDAAMAEYLQGRVCYHLADRSTGGLLFHAAALRHNGRGLVIPGISSAGKSTLTAWLLSHGFDYLTDELTFVADGASEFAAFTRPLNIKPASRQLLSARLVDIGDVLTCETASLIPLASLGAPDATVQTPLSGILFVHYDAAAPFEWARLSPAQAGLALMQCLVNARNLPEHGFREASRLARQTPAFRLVYRGFGELEPRLPELLASFPRSDTK